MNAMTTLPHTLLSVQEIEDLMLKAALHSWTPEQLARSIESKAIAAYAAKLAQGVELEGFRLTWHSDQARYTVSKPNIDTMDVVPVSTAQAAVAAAILQEREALNDEAADMVVRLQDEKEAAVAAERAKAQVWRKAVQEAYGWLWHVNNEPAAPVPLWSPDQAAYKARQSLRELLTHQERGEAINAIRGLLRNTAAAASAAGGEHG